MEHEPGSAAVNYLVGADAPVACRRAVNATMRSFPLSAMILALAGVILMGLGLYFVLLRPPLLPEDLRYMGASLSQVRDRLPGLLLWAQRVMWVTGGYVAATGLLIVYVAVTNFRARAKSAAGIVAVAGLASIGWMAIVNFVIGSDFKWLMVLFLVPWVLALVFYCVESPTKQ